MLTAVEAGLIAGATGAAGRLAPSAFTRGSNSSLIRWMPAVTLPTLAGLVT